jgi:hypothetical protein
MSAFRKSRVSSSVARWRPTWGAERTPCKQVTGHAGQPGAHTGWVLQCQVLRCQESATRNFVVDHDGSGLYETVVCEIHAAALKTGRSYVYNSVENVIYMDEDASIQQE